MSQIVNLVGSILGGIPGIIVGIVLFILTLVVASIAKKIVIAIGKKVGLGSKLQKMNVVKDEAQGADIIGMFGSLAYLVVFLIMIPSALSYLGMRSVADPIVNMLYIGLGILPNLLGAGIVLFIGYLIAKILKEVVSNILRAMRLDEAINKVAKLEEGKVVFSNLIGTIVFALIFIPIIVTALDILKLDAVSKPAVNVMAMIFAFIPNIIVSAIMIAIGLFLAKLLGNIISGVLVTVGVDKCCSDENCCKMLGKNKPSTIITMVVKTFVIGIFVIEAINALKLTVLSNISNTLLGYMPNIIAAGTIIAVAFLGIKCIARIITNKMALLVIKTVIYVFVGFMILNQLGIAPAIVSMTFMFVMGAISIAFILAFGLGGKDFAKDQLTKISNKMNKE